MFSETIAGTKLISNRELPLQDVVTAVTEPKHRNGVEVQMEHAPYVMRVDYVSSNSRTILDADILTFQLDYAKLTRKMGSKPSATGSNLRPKEISQGSP